MNLPDLGLLYKILTWHKTRENPNEHVGLFLPTPSHITNQFPEDGKEGEDDSPSHVTLLYMGNVPGVFEDRIKEVVSEVCSSIKPFTVKLSKPRRFCNDKDQIVLHSPVKSQKLKRLHDILKSELLKVLVPVSDKYPEYKGHVTIEYANPGKRPRYRKLRPAGSWLVDSVFLWGFEDPHLIPFGK